MFCFFWKKRKKKQNNGNSGTFLGIMEKYHVGDISAQNWIDFLHETISPLRGNL